MSEPTSESGHLEQVDEPSMEDILASIRKIIADDDQVMDIAPPQPMDTPEGVEEGMEFSLTETGADNTVNVPALSTPSHSRTLDEDSVFKGLLSEDDVSDERLEASASDAEVVDLDIESLLGGPMTSSPSLDIPAIDREHGLTESLASSFDMEAFDMPDLDDSSNLTVSPETQEALSNFLNSDDEMGKSNLRDEENQAAESFSDNEPIDSLLTGSSVPPVDENLAEDEDEDSLFAELETLLADSSDTDSDTDSGTNIVDPQTTISDEGIEPVVKPEPKRNRFTASLAGLGLGKSKPNTKNDTSQISDDAAKSEAPKQAIQKGGKSEYESMLNQLVIDNDGEKEDDPLDLNFVESDGGMDFDFDVDLAGPALSSDDTDIDLVKSLMADLTEPETSSEAGEQEPQTSVFQGRSGESTDSTSEDTPPLDSENEANIMDEILNMSMEDALTDSDSDTLDNTTYEDIEALLEIPTPEAPVLEDITADDIAADEVENLNENAELSAEVEAFSLTEIAASAESDAIALETEGLQAETASPEMELDVESLGSEDEAILPIDEETSLGVGALGAVVGTAIGAGAVMASVKTGESSTTETIDLEVPLSKSVSEEEIEKKETANMARAAAKSDAILDDVTETATADAFASLNQLVESQAITAERGDRIGDLVMEALRPMLKEWLDSNLKGIVERAVTKEVKRIASGK